MQEAVAALNANLKPMSCARAGLSAQVTMALSHCQQCVHNTVADSVAFACMGKMAYLRQDYEAACKAYIRSAAVSLLKSLDTDELVRLRRLAATDPDKATEYAIKQVAEHDPTLVYHLGHAWHALTTSDDQHSHHLTRYIKGLRRLTPEAYDPPTHLLLHFHDQGINALRCCSTLLLAVFEKYCRLTEQQLSTANHGL